MKRFILFFLIFHSFALLATERFIVSKDDKALEIYQMSVAPEQKIRIRDGYWTNGLDLDVFIKEVETNLTCYEYIELPTKREGIYQFNRFYEGTHFCIEVIESIN